MPSWPACPTYYGLYAAFLPPMLAALFGSSRQLATGPVAVVSLMTAASLAPLATAGSRRLYRLCHPAGPDGGGLSTPARHPAAGPGGEFPVPPGGQRFHQRGGHDHRHLPVGQNVRGLGGHGRTSLRNHHPGRPGRCPLHPLAHPDHGRGGLRHHVRTEKNLAQGPQCAGGGGDYHPYFLGHRFSTR